MSKNHPHDNIYSILGKLDALTPKEAPKAEAPTLKEYANIPAKGSILEGVKTIEQTLAEKYMGFKKLEKSIAAKGDVRDAGAVAAAIGREKYGKKAFQKAAATGHKMGETLDGGMGSMGVVGEETCMECGMYESECGCDHTNEDMSRAAKGYEKYGKKGMQALAKAGREGASEEELDKIRDQHDHYNESKCNECGMWESKCSCDHDMTEGETTRKDGVTRHTKTDYPGYPSDDLEKDDGDAPKSKGGKGRPRKATTKNPRRDADAPKKGKGRPAKSDSEKSDAKLPFSSKNAVGHDPFGRVKDTEHLKHKPKAKKVDEKAVSQAQQRFMGMAHAIQKGEKIKGASPELKKVARTMKPKATHDYAATKHKGLPQHVAESVNFKRMMDEQHMTLEEMIACMQEDMLHFKKTGICSDRLRDMMEVYAHAKKQMEENVLPFPGQQVPAQQPSKSPWEHVKGGNPANPHPVGSSLPANQIPGKAALLKGKGRDYYEEDAMEAELNELAKLAGLKMADEGNAFTGKLKNTAKGDKFELDGKEYTDISNLDEDPEAEFEGNEFSGELAKARAQHKDSFSVDGKEYPVKEADAPVEEPVDKPVNQPKKKYFSMKGSTMNPGEGDSGEKRQYPPHPAGDNGMTEPARKMPIKNGIKEDALSLEARLAAEYESIKKVN